MNNIKPMEGGRVIPGLGPRDSPIPSFLSLFPSLTQGQSLSTESQANA